MFIFYFQILRAVPIGIIRPSVIAVEKSALALGPRQSESLTERISSVFLDYFLELSLKIMFEL